MPEYLKLVLAIAVFVILLAWETLAPFFRHPTGRARLGHGLRNVALGVLNAALTAAVFVGIWWAVAAWAERQGFGLFHALAWPTAIEWLLALLLLDAWTYLLHRLMHRLPFLWRFHRVHHSDPHMDVTTANRFHTGEIVIAYTLRVPLIVIFGLAVPQIVLYEILMFAVVQFHHANVGVSAKWDRLLRIFIVSPVMHKIHHSRWRPETDSNYASLLSVWDRIFHSFRMNDRPESIRLGLDGFDSDRDQTFPGLLKTPLTNPEKPRKP